MRPVEPILLANLLSEIQSSLLLLLKHLPPGDWNKPTAAPAWTVKDVAAHLLDGDIRRLSFQRDGLPQSNPDSPIQSYADLVSYLNQLNADWIKVTRRLSPQVLTSFLEVTSPQVCELFKSLDPFAPAMWSVAWAGEETSLNWFDIAREYTEKWHHQQQIREAVGALGLNSRRWLYPVLDTFLRALPHIYRAVQAEEGTTVSVEIKGESGGDWGLIKETSRWTLYEGRMAESQSRIEMDQDTAWRMMTKGLSQKQAAERIMISGERRWGEPMLGMLAVMA